MSFLTPLDIDGMTIAGLAFRAGAYDQHQDAAVMFELELGVPGSRTRTPLIRLDWRPLSPVHKNPPKGPPEHQRKLIRGTHCHPFELNWIEDMQRMRTGNLPIAIEILPDFQTFSEVLDYSKNLFRINNIDAIPVPEWSPQLNLK